MQRSFKDNNNKVHTTMTIHIYTIERSSRLARLAVSVVWPATSGNALYFKSIPQCTINFSKFPTGNC